MDEFEHNRRIVDERKKINNYRRKLYAQKRLESNIIKKINTTMIGAIASVEDGFGHLWGIDLHDDELDRDHLELREIWEEVRREILNKGNMQKRAAQDEISEYDTEWHRYKTDFITKKEQEQ